jgi:hypothetical protein
MLEGRIVVALVPRGLRRLHPCYLHFITRGVRPPS